MSPVPPATAARRSLAPAHPRRRGGRRALIALAAVAAITGPLGLAACGSDPGLEPTSAEGAQHTRTAPRHGGHVTPARPGAKPGSRGSTDTSTRDSSPDATGTGDSSAAATPGGPSTGSPVTAPSATSPSGATPSGATPSGTATPTGPSGANPSGTASGPTPSGSTSPTHAVALAATRTTGCPTPAKAVVHSAGRKGRTVALTFDDGPSATTTPQVLALLTKHHVHATFFVVGVHAAASPKLLRRIEAQGSLIGNHSWSHPLPHHGGAFDKLPLPTQLDEIDRTQRAVHQAVGHDPCFLRAPGGQDRQPGTLAAARSRGLTLVNWDVDTRDWAAPGHADAKAQASIAKIATARTADGRTQPIVLFHDGSPGAYRGNMLAVLDKVITWYEQHGYTFTDPLGRAFA
ncbi:MAG: polysaccharide deacetylase family protein [Kineosporiaceae bacterium]